MFVINQFFKISFLFISLYFSVHAATATEIEYEYNDRGLITKIGDQVCKSDDKCNEYRQRASMKTEHNVELKNGLSEKCNIQTIPLTPSHFDDLETLFKHEEVMKFYELGHVRTKEKDGEDYKTYVAKRGKEWVARTNQGQLSWWACYDTINGIKGNFMGAVGTAYIAPDSKENPNCVELAGLANPDYQGKGFAGSVVPDIIDFIWKEKPDCGGIYAPIHPENKKSWTLAEKLGFKNIEKKYYISEAYNQPRCYYFLENPKKNQNKK